MRGKKLVFAGRPTGSKSIWKVILQPSRLSVMRPASSGRKRYLFELGSDVFLTTVWANAMAEHSLWWILRICLHDTRAVPVLSSTRRHSMQQSLGAQIDGTNANDGDPDPYLVVVWFAHDGLLVRQSMVTGFHWKPVKFSFFWLSRIRRMSCRYRSSRAGFQGWCHRGPLRWRGCSRHLEPHHRSVS